MSKKKNHRKQQAAAAETVTPDAPEKAPEITLEPELQEALRRTFAELGTQEKKTNRPALTVILDAPDEPETRPESKMDSFGLGTALASMLSEQTPPPEVTAPAAEKIPAQEAQPALKQQPEPDTKPVFTFPPAFEATSEFALDGSELDKLLSELKGGLLEDVPSGTHEDMADLRIDLPPSPPETPSNSSENWPEKDVPHLPKQQAKAPDAKPPLTDTLPPVAAQAPAQRSKIDMDRTIRFRLSDLGAAQAAEKPGKEKPEPAPESDNLQLKVTLEPDSPQEDAVSPQPEAPSQAETPRQETSPAKKETGWLARRRQKAQQASPLAADPPKPEKDQPPAPEAPLQEQPQEDAALMREIDEILGISPEAEEVPGSSVEEPVPEQQLTKPEPPAQETVPVITPDAGAASAQKAEPKPASVPKTKRRSTAKARTRPALEPKPQPAPEPEPVFVSIPENKPVPGTNEQPALTPEPEPVPDAIWESRAASTQVSEPPVPADLEFEPEPPEPLPEGEDFWAIVSALKQTLGVSEEAPAAAEEPRQQAPEAKRDAAAETAQAAEKPQEQTLKKPRTAKKPPKESDKRLEKTTRFVFTEMVPKAPELTAAAVPPKAPAIAVAAGPKLPHPQKKGSARAAAPLTSAKPLSRKPPEDAPGKLSEAPEETPRPPKRMPTAARRPQAAVTNTPPQPPEQTKRPRPSRRPKRSAETVILHPEEAYRKERKDLGNMGLRLILLGLLNLIGIFLTVYAQLNWHFLPQFMDRITISYMLLVLLIAMVGLCHDLFSGGLKRLQSGRFGLELLLLLAAVFTGLDTFAAASAGRVSLCGVTGVLLLFALWGRYDSGIAAITTLRVLCDGEAPTGIVEVQDVMKGRRGISRAEGSVKNFMDKLRQRSLAETAMDIYAPIAAAAALALAAVISLRTAGSFLWTASVVLLGSVPLAGLMGYARLSCLLAKRLSASHAALCGWHGAEVFGGDHSILIGDSDLFPKKQVTFNGIKAYAGNLDRVIGYAAATFQAAGSALYPLFEELLTSRNGRHYIAERYRYYEGGGIGAEINGDIVLLGSISFMKRMGVHMDGSAKLRQAVYASVNGELAAVFALKYTPTERVRRGLLSVASNRHFKLILVTRDFLITPDFLRSKFEIPIGNLVYPGVNERIRLSETEFKDKGEQGALLAEDSFSGFAEAVAGGRVLKSTGKLTVAVAILSGLLSMGLMILLTYLGAVETANAGNLLLYLLGWSIPTLLLSSWTRRY